MRLDAAELSDRHQVEQPLGPRMVGPHVRLERWRSAARAEANTASVSAPDNVSGFSHRTCLPASNAFVTHSTCSELGGVM